MSEKDAINQVFADIRKLFLYKTYGLNYRLTYREYISIVAPLLGQSLQFSDIERSDIQRKLVYQEELQKSENIIFPIYDALLKAKKKLGTIPKIDAVLLNGGMSKLQVLRHRLQEFFGQQTPIIESPSPDLSVARGAVIHHYNLVNGLDRTSSLLPEAISLEVKGTGTFIQLVPANTQYPTNTPIVPKGIQFVIPGSGIPYIDIPLWRGEPPRPTAKLIDRRIDLRDKASGLIKGDVVDIQITIDANRHLKLEARLQRNPNIRFEVGTVMA
jgi:molecular chaperone DnaK (HSP70)